MIPEWTLRERMREALEGHVGNLCDDAGLSERVAEVTLELIVKAAIEAIGDPVLIKTADTLEPTFTLRAQDNLAEDALDKWLTQAEDLELDEAKIAGAETHLDAFRAWPTRKWPD